METTFDGRITFGQSEPLTRRLRGLVRSYPKGIGIIKELLQNADDAGAEKAHVLIDWRMYPSERLPDASMQPLMGPALLFYNDAIFTDDDLKGIQEIGVGAKIRSGLKTGRFGLGFNACYNITDCPSFITREAIYFFDPHRCFIPGATVNNPGGAWPLAYGWQNFPDLLRPFEMLGLSPGQDHYEGTVFRFPLRTEKHVQWSEISQEAFRRKDFKDILAQTTKLSAELLLFLKNVLELRISEIKEDASEPQVLLEVTTENVGEVREQRQLLNKSLEGAYDAVLEELQSIELPRVSYRQVIRVQTPDDVHRQSWRVVGGLYRDMDGELLKVAREMYSHGEKAVPWAGAAARIDVEGGKDNDLVEGGVYCFLPLSDATGLPVHINGYFDLDSSRQKLTGGLELVGKDALRGQWNQLLIKHAVAEAYADLVITLVNDVGESDLETFYKFWPDIAKAPNGVLGTLPEAVYEHLKDKNVIRCAGERKWLDVNRIKQLPPGWSKLYEPLTLEGLSLPDPKLPPFIMQGFKKVGAPGAELTPAEVRDQYRIEHDLLLPIRPLEEVERESLRQREWVVSLLRFCLSDHPGSELKGLPLALTCDGKLRTFGYFNKVAFLATEEEREIFSPFPYWFLDPAFAQESDLDADEDINTYDLHKMTFARVVKNLQHILNNEVNECTWNPEGDALPNSVWLQRLYTYLTSKSNEGFGADASALNKLCIVPNQFGQLHRMGSAETPLLGMENTSKSLLKALDALNIPVVHGTQELVDAVGSFQQAYPDKYISDCIGF